MEFTLEPPYLIVKPVATEEDFSRDAGEDSDWEYLDPGLDVREKLPPYREAGIEAIWLLNPFERTLRVETKDLRATDRERSRQGASSHVSCPASG